MYQDSLSKQSFNVAIATFPENPVFPLQIRDNKKTPLYASTIHAQPFSQKLEIFFPVADVNVGYKLAPVMELQQKHFYSVKQSPMDFTAKETKEFIKSSIVDVYAISVGRKTDTDDVFAIYPHGEMVLSLTKDTYTSTGLSTDNKYSTRQSATYGPAMLDIAPSLVSISLRDSKPQTQVDFVRTKKIIPPVTFFLSFVDSANDSATKKATFDESKLQTIFPSITRFLINSERQTLRGLQVPIISYDNLVTLQPTSTARSRETPSRSVNLIWDPEGINPSDTSIDSLQLNEEFVEDVLEWVGALHCRVRSYVEGNLIDPAVSLVSPHAIERAPMQGLVFNHEGLISPANIIHQLKQAKSIVDAEMAPYAVLTAWAFVDQPLHHPEYFRDSYYTIIVLPDNKYLTIRPSL